VPIFLETLMSLGDERHQRLAAILAADAAGYSRLMGIDEAGTLAALDAARAVFRAHIESNHGRVIDMAGDSVLAAFETAAGAVTASLAIQEQLEGLIAGVPADRRMRFRIGVHLGDVIEKADGTVYGEGVNIAARLEGLALPGGLTISDAVHGAVRHRVAATFEDLGEQQVKNIVDPVRVFRVFQASAQAADESLVARLPPASPLRSLVGALRTGRGLATVAVLIGVVISLWSYSRGNLPPRSAPVAALPAMSLGVMPLAVPSGDSAMAQRGEEWTRSVTAMVGLDDCAMRVVPLPASKANAVEANRDVGKLGLALNVRYVLEGDVRSAPEGVIGDMHLINSSTGEQVWSGTTSVTASDTRDAEMRKLRKTATDIRSSLSASERRRALAQPLSEATAMDYVLRARAVSAGSEGGTVQSTHEAQRLYEEALRRDPNFMPALVGLAWEMSAEIDTDPQVDYARAVRRWDELTALAVKLDPAHPDGWEVRSAVLSYLGQGNAALEAVERAVRLDPYGGHVLQQAWVLTNAVGRPADALALLEPYISANLGGFGLLRGACEAHLLLGQFEQAIARCERAKGLESGDWWVDLFLAAAYANHGDMAKARAAIDEVQRLVPGYSMARLRANKYSVNPDFLHLAEANFHSGLRKAGLPEK
jgi:adenylate cyclase